jgi:hypothetical protein
MSRIQEAFQSFGQLFSLTELRASFHSAAFILALLDLAALKK